MSTKSLVQLGIAILALAGAALLFTRTTNRAPRIDFNPYQALGRVAGEEASRLLGDQGKIVVITPDPGSSRDPVLEAELDVFRQALKEHGRVAVKAVENAKMDPFLSMRTGGALPADQFADFQKKHPDVDGFVLFIGFPALSAAELAGLGQKRPKLIVVSAALPGYEVLLRDGLIDLAIVPKSVSTDVATPPPKTLREVFDQEYIILRADRTPH